MFHFWFPTDDSNTSLMYRSDEEKKKKKNSNTQDLQSIEVLLWADFVGSAIFFLPHQ